MVSSGGSEVMNNNENNNEILSFEELRKKLGMDDQPKAELKKTGTVSETKPTVNDDIFAEIEQTLNENSEIESVIEPKQVVENGKTFVDITEQYVKKKL